MTLKDFIRIWIAHNTLIRLWIPNDEGGHTMLCESVDGEDHEVGMEHQILNGKGWQAKYANWRVLYVTDILCDSYWEAVNIVITDNNSKIAADLLSRLNNSQKKESKDA